MEDDGVLEDDYTKVTVCTIITISLSIIAYFLISDTTEIVADVLLIIEKSEIFGFVVSIVNLGMLVISVPPA